MQSQLGDPRYLWTHEMISIGFSLNTAANVYSTAPFWVITQQVVVISYQRLGQPIVHIFRSQESNNPFEFLVGCANTSVRNYHYSLSNNPEEGSTNLLCGRSLKSCVFIQCSNTCKRQLPVRVNALISLYVLTLLCQIQGSRSSDIKTAFC